MGTPARQRPSLIVTCTLIHTGVPESDLPCRFVGISLIGASGRSAPYGSRAIRRLIQRAAVGRPLSFSRQLDRLGINLLAGSWQTAIHRLPAILAFWVGVRVSQTILLHAKRRDVSAPYSSALALEIGILAREGPC